ncbi:MAG: MoaD/ThiS family protein [Anaerolineae bacterium]
MSVTFAIPAPYRKSTGGEAEVSLAAGTVGEAVAALAAKYPSMGPRLLVAEGKLNPFVSVYVNGDQVLGPEALNRPLRDGDRLLVMPVVGGGH